MKTNRLSLGPLALALALALAAAACASSSAGEALPASSASSPIDAPKEPALLSGTWRFDLASSDAAKPIREACANESGGDPTKADACFREVLAKSAREKIRFATGAAGHIVWTSLATLGPKETVYLEVPVELAAEGPGRVRMTIAGVPVGEHAAEFAKSKVETTSIELVDARTIAMSDPRKGRLVFAKE